MRGGAALLALAVAVFAQPTTASAQPREGAPVSAADREAAQRAFAQGQRAYRLGDFRHAAERFESAYAHAPHPDALWNAARAWHKARELSRAANLYAKYLREAAPNARDRNSATAALKELAPRVARIDVVAPDFQDLRVDSRALDGTSVYVSPGEHVVEGSTDGKPVRQTAKVAAGDVMSVALVPPSQAPPPAPTSAPPPSSSPVPIVTGTASSSPTSEPHDEGASKSHGWSPVVVVVGGVATALAGGFTIWSGIDTANARSNFNGTQQALDDGLAKEHRTNIALAVTGALGAFTLVSAIFLVDWHGKPEKAAATDVPPVPGPSVGLGVGPGYASLEGRF